MKKKELLKNLRNVNDWRKGADIPMPNPTEYGRWLDSAITVIEKTNTDFVHRILSHKEIVDKIKVTRGAMILDGYDEEDSCIKLMDELIKEIEDGK